METHHLHHGATGNLHHARYISFCFLQPVTPNNDLVGGREGERENRMQYTIAKGADDHHFHDYRHDECQLERKKFKSVKSL